MAAGHLQGRLLKLLTTMIRPRNILEIGTYTGYSAICMAEGLTEGGKVYTFEINDEQEVFTRPWIEGSDVAERIRFIIGDALEMAPRLVMEEGVQFDMVYIDGDKKAYTEYYEMALSLMKSGGYIIADNTLWDGHVIDPAYDKEPQTVGVRTFNDLIAKDPRVEKVILPLRDGLTIAHIL
jgi:predicted O-methyltransferase YrrM